MWSQHAVAPLISDLVARLPTLKDLHERAAQFAGIMADSQDKLTNQISDLQSLLTTVAHNTGICITYTPPHPSQIWTKWVWSQHAVAPLISDLVARLPTLKDLHERAAQFAGIMADSQEKLTNQISDLQSLLTLVAHNINYDMLLQVQGTFQNNLSTIQSEFSGLESKLKTE